MNYGRGAGLDAFRRCGCPGCRVMVYAPLSLEEVRCTPHGGAEDQMTYIEADPYGEPDRVDAGEALPSPALHA